MSLHLTPYASRLTPHLLSLLLLLYFWTAGLAHLDRYPKIHEDESWQAAPGYTFWAEGRFGTNLFAGFYGMEQHYYGFMPLFPILVGGALHLFGLGLFQARLVPLALILLTLALTHRLGTRLFSPWHGVLAVAILATWRVAGPFPHLPSGIPLADVARIVRYDSAVPLFGLAALLLFITTADPFDKLRMGRRPIRQAQGRPPTTETPHSPFAIRYSQFRARGPLAAIHNSEPEAPWRQFTIHLFIGFLTGLAALSHVYGAFWLPALLLAMLWLRGWQAVKPAVITLIGFGLTLTPWLLFVASGWSDFVQQNRNYADRFGLLDSRFYLINLLNEVERYDPILNGAKQSLGAWLWLIGGSLSLIWLLRSTFNFQRSTFIPARILVSALIIVGGLFAFLLSFKTFSYLAMLWPLFALVIAAGFMHLWQAPTPRRWWRPVLALFFLAGMAEGVLTSVRFHQSARQLTPYQTFTGAISPHLPPQSQVLGLQHYWLGLAARHQSYQSILVPIFWTNPSYVSQPLSFMQAVQMRPPQIILLDQIMLDFLTETAQPNHPLHQLGQGIWTYLAEREARLIGQLDDPTYGRLQIYELKK